MHFSQYIFNRSVISISVSASKIQALNCTTGKYEEDIVINRGGYICIA